jgi:hypothetical protein
MPMKEQTSDQPGPVPLAMTGVIRRPLGRPGFAIVLVNEGARPR